MLYRGKCHSGMIKKAGLGKSLICYEYLKIRKIAVFMCVSN